MATPQPDIMARAAKLLALAEDATNQHESAVAAAKLQKLLMLHRLSIDALREVANRAEAVIYVTLEETGRDVDWKRDLAAIIAAHFRCASITRQQRNAEGKRRRYILMVGLNDDALLASAVYRSARAAMERNCLAYVGKWRTNLDKIRALIGGGKVSRMDISRTRLSYLTGYADGIHRALTAQEHQQSWALMLVTPSAVTEAVTGVPEGGYTEAADDPGTYDLLALTAGRQAGLQFSHTQEGPADGG